MLADRGQLKRLPSEFVLEVHDNGRLDEADSSTLTWGKLLMDYYAKKRHAALTVQTSRMGHSGPGQFSCSG